MLVSCLVLCFVQYAALPPFGCELILFHLALFAGVLAYFQVCIRILQGIACVRASDGSLRLLADLSLRCYSDFPATAFFNFLFLFVYIIAFPVLCVYLVYRGTHKSTRSASSISTPSHSIGNADDADKQLDVPDEQPASTKQAHSNELPVENETSDTNEPARQQQIASRMNRQSTSRVVHDRLHDPKRTSKYGFLYRDLKVLCPRCLRYLLVLF